MTFPREVVQILSGVAMLWSLVFCACFYMRDKSSIARRVVDFTLRDFIVGLSRASAYPLITALLIFVCFGEVTEANLNEVTALFISTMLASFPWMFSVLIAEPPEKSSI